MNEIGPFYWDDPYLTTRLYARGVQPHDMRRIEQMDRTKPAHFFVTAGMFTEACSFKILPREGTI